MVGRDIGQQGRFESAGNRQRVDLLVSFTGRFCIRTVSMVKGRNVGALAELDTKWIAGSLA